MNLDEIEEEYKTETEKATEEFLEQIKKEKDYQKSEELYKLKLKKIRERYYYKTTSYLDKAKKNPKLKQYNLKKELTKPFKVDDSPLEITKWQKFKLKLELLKFRTSIRVKKFFVVFYILGFTFIFKWMRLKIRLFSAWLTKTINRNIYLAKKDLVNVGNKISNLFKKVFVRSKPKTEEKKPEEKLN